MDMAGRGGQRRQAIRPLNESHWSTSSARLRTTQRGFSSRSARASNSRSSVSRCDHRKPSTFAPLQRRRVNHCCSKPSSCEFGALGSNMEKPVTFLTQPETRKVSAITSIWTVRSGVELMLDERRVYRLFLKNKSLEL